MRRTMLAAVLPLMFAMPGCDDSVGAEETSVCAEAQAAVETCLGAAAEPPAGTCEGDQVEIAQELLAGIDTAGCEGVPQGKEDSLLCAALLWDPLGWCDEPPAALGPEPEGTATQYPIILAHGFNTSTTNFWRFNDVDVALIEDGHDVMLGSVPPFDTPQVRAGFLADQIDELLARSGKEQVNLVCFSMGGIDCRYLVSPDGLGYADKVASVTTISAPHRGTYVADVAVGLLPDEDDAEAIDAIATLFGRTFSEVADDSHIVAGLQAMSERGMAEFNAAIFDAPGVMYQSLSL
ncbi:MAG: alpha/beta fold hydrolase, partial [Nannocystaceae bacterium]|nr:alpha/beta fold hydrolase [Nannocystaceae bacterium]